MVQRITFNRVPPVAILIVSSRCLKSTRLSLIQEYYIQSAILYWLSLASSYLTLTSEEKGVKVCGFTFQCCQGSRKYRTDLPRLTLVKYRPPHE